MAGDAALTLYRGRASGQRRVRLAELLGAVLGTPIAAHGDGPWEAVALFAPEGRCVAALEFAILPLILDGAAASAAAIRSVAVDPAWRGRGLFRRITTEALASADRRTTGPTLLYTEEPALYERFGFRMLAQHAFAGPPPQTQPSPPARPLGIDDAATFVRRWAPRRAPISAKVALGVDPDLILAKLAEGDWNVALLAEPETLIVFGGDATEFIVADVIGERIPSLAAILGGLGREPRRIKVMFSPDRLGWRDGVAEPEDTGLMIRGAIPPAMTRPFMLPPTAEF